MSKIPNYIGHTVEREPFVLPDDAVTQGFAILGKRGRGKSVLAGDIIEIFAKRGHRFVVMDPPDAHWGIRYSTDENGRPAGLSGIEVLLVGGEHGDVPLDPHGGRELARIIVQGDIDCVISMKHMGYTEQQRFAADFEEELFLINRTARFLLWEEAHNFLPQNLKFDEQKRVLYASEKIVQEGRGSGLGFGIVSQRPASVNKSILEQTDNFIALGMIGPNDLDQVENWFKHQMRGEGETLKERNADRQAKLQALIDDLAQMDVGQCWFLSPVWMRCRTRLHFRMRSTYHAGRTPEPGEKPVNVKKFSVGEAVERLKKLFESKKAAQQKEVADFNEAKKRIHELQIELAKAQKLTINNAKLSIGNKTLPKAKVSQAEILRVLQREVEPWRQYAQTVRRRLVESLDLLHKIIDISKDFADKSDKLTTTPIPDYPVLHSNLSALKAQVVANEPVPVVVVRPNPMLLPPHRTEARPHPAHHGSEDENGELPQGEKEVLMQIARYVHGVEPNQLTVLTGYKRSSRNQYLQRLKTRHLIEDRRGLIVANEAGIAALGSAFNPQPATGAELQEYWMSELPDGEKRVLKLLIAEAGVPVAGEKIDEATGYKRSSRNQYLQRLRSRGLVEKVGSEVKAAPSLFV